MENYNSKDVSVAQRQIYILSLLSQNPQGYTVNELVDKLRKWDIDVSRRTVTRDIDELSLNYGIYEDERGNDTYFKADKYNLKNVDLTPEDMISIAFLRQLLNDYERTAMGENASKLLDRITSKDSPLNKMHMEELKNTIRNVDIIKGKNSEVNPDYEKLINSAIEKKNQIEIEYYSFNSDECTRRVVNPYAIILNDGYLCVEAYCTLRKSVRTFRISRIQSIKLLDSHFEVSSEFMINRQNRQFIHLTGENIKHIILEFDKETGRFIKEYEKSLADDIKDIDDKVIFEKNCPINGEVIRWILGFGSGVKVIEPEELVDKVKEEINKMYNIY